MSDVVDPDGFGPCAIFPARRPNGDVNGRMRFDLQPMVGDRPAGSLPTWVEFSDVFTAGEIAQLEALLRRGRRKALEQRGYKVSAADSATVKSKQPRPTPTNIVPTVATRVKPKAPSLVTTPVPTTSDEKKPTTVVVTKPAAAVKPSGPLPGVAPKKTLTAPEAETKAEAKAETKAEAKATEKELPAVKSKVSIPEPEAKADAETKPDTPKAKDKAKGKGGKNK